MRALIVILLCACASPAREEARWRAAKQVYAVVDIAAYVVNVRQALADKGAGQVKVGDAPIALKKLDGGAVVYFNLDDIPAKTSYTPMTPHQALEAALKQDPYAGVCADPVGFECGRKLDRIQVELLEAALRPGALKEPFRLLSR